MNIKTIIIALMTLSSVHGFNSIKPNTNFKYVGDTKPIGYFDPMKITSRSPNELIKYVRKENYSMVELRWLDLYLF